VSPTHEAAGVVVEDDLRRFPIHMRALLDPHTNGERSREARRYFAEHYSAEVCARRYKELFEV